LQLTFLKYSFSYVSILLEKLGDFLDHKTPDSLVSVGSLFCLNLPFVAYFP
jgi:hypothetical protein